ncbi:MAG: VWA domain-containing protein [Sedimentisphaerales bacterium]|nr:VWA domain-containing protein [Sedimentisphaerales bacterium]
MGLNLIFDPLVSVPVLLGIGVVTGLVVVFVYARTARGMHGFLRIGLTLVRIGVLCALLVLLMRPMALVPQKEVRDKPVLAVLVDTSLSMNTKDVENRTRYEAALGVLQAKKSSLLTKLGRNYDVQLFGFDVTLRRTALRFLAGSRQVDGSETHIGAALTDVVGGGANSRTRGVLLLSDGRSNEVDPQSSMRSAARYLRTLKVPVWTVPIGTASEVKDVHVLARVNSNFLLAGQPAALNVSLVGTGYTDWTAGVHVFREDKYVTSKQLMLENGHAETSIPIREEHRGVFQYRVEVDPLPGESDLDNNKRSVIARVIDDKTEVLVVEARPHWDSKFLLRTLRADMNVEVTSIFYINPDKTFAVVEKLAEDKTTEKTVLPGLQMPRTRDELRRYDCIFLGKDIDEVFSSGEMKALQEYVGDDGGSVVFFRGRPYEQSSPELAKIEPVRWGDGVLTDVPLELTEEGKANPIFDYGSRGKSSETIVRELPAMTSVTRVTDEKSLAVVLARIGQDRRSERIATVVYHRYGKGKVMSIGSAGLWQWGFLPERLEQYDDIYGRFWSQMIRWLVSGSDFLPGRDISFQIDKSAYRPGEMIRMTVSAKLVERARYKPRIELTQPDGGKVRLTPEPLKSNEAVYVAHYTPAAEGEYEAILYSNVGKPEKDIVRFTVYDDSVEQRCVQADREMMNLIADVTGGEMLEVNELEALPDKIQAFETLARERVKPRDIWDRLPVFGTLICVLGVEWFLRRASGLL